MKNYLFNLYSDFRNDFNLENRKEDVKRLVDALKGSKDIFKIVI